MTQQLKPAYLYARYSSNHQKESSIARQVYHGRAFAQQQGWQLVAELKDEAKSAFKGVNRLAGSALYDFERDAREGKFADGAVLVCENIDRLSRQGAKASAKLIWALNEAGVDVATYHDGHIYKAGAESDMMDMFSIIIKGALSQEESGKKSDRSRAYWEKKYREIAAGNREAHSRQCPAWFDIVDGKYVLNEHRAEIVRKIYNWYCDGLGSVQILYKIRELGERPWSREERYKDRPEWTIRYLHKLLKARQTIGEYVTVRGETIATDYYPAVIDIAVFNRAQEMRARRKKLGGDSNVRVHNLFLGIAKCGECGRAATVTHKMTKKRGITGYIRCNEARYRHIECQNQETIFYHVLESTVLEYALPLIAAAKNERTETNRFEAEIAEHQRQIQVKQKQVDNIVDAVAGGDAPKALVARMATLEQEIEQHQAAAKSLRLEWSQEQTRPSKADDTAIVAELRAAFESDDPVVAGEARAAANAALGRIIDRIDIEPTGTFRIWVKDDAQIYRFDKDGTMLGYEVELQ